MLYQIHPLPEDYPLPLASLCLPESSRCRVHRRHDCLLVPAIVCYLILLPSALVLVYSLDTMTAGSRTNVR